jgi:hypothetical protein
MNRFLYNRKEETINILAVYKYRDFHLELPEILQ